MVEWVVAGAQGTLWDVQGQNSACQDTARNEDGSLMRQGFTLQKNLGP